MRVYEPGVTSGTSITAVATARFAFHFESRTSPMSLNSFGGDHQCFGSATNVASFKAR